MKSVFTIIVLIAIGILITAGVVAQSPEKMSYQAVIRNSSDQLVTNQVVGMQISILQGTVSGEAVYIETHNPTTNANGLVSIEIGGGTLVSGSFSSIDWSNGPFFIKTETDPTGSTNYTITGTSQLLSVPYALHAKTAENITGTISETDPVFATSIAKGITGTDTANWNDKLSSYTETDPVFGTSLAKGITGIDTANWNDKLSSYTETDPVFGTSLAKGITGTDTANWNDKLSSYTEIDPVFGTSIASGITSSDTMYWNKKQDISPGTVLQMVVLTCDSISSLNVTTFTEVSNYYRISVKPKRANSIFLIEYYFPMNTALAPNTIFEFQLIRNIGGTEVPVGVGPVNGDRNQATYVSRPNNGYDGNDQQNVYLVAKDSNLDMDSTYTYGFKYRRETAGSGTTYFNYSNGNSSVYGFSGIMTMKITEIAQ